MRFHALFAAIVAALVLPQTGNAQVYSAPSQPPRVTAARSTWRIGNEPILYAGGLYYPTGPTEYFDGNVMSQTGNYNGVPLYENRTLEPYSLVYVPIGRNLMRPYERKRDGDLAGTVGSRTPSFPIQRDGELSLLGYQDALTEPVDVDDHAGRAQWDWPEPTTVADVPPLAPLSTRSAASMSLTGTLPPRETTNAGAFIQFEGARYFSSGRARVNDAQRFARVGALRGATVYREVKGDAQTIYVESVPGGSLAPYTRR